MFNFKRLWMVLSSALTLGVAGVLVLAGTAPGASALRSVANNLSVAAHAAGGGTGGMTITILPTGSLTAKLAATVNVSYTCSPIIDIVTGHVETVLQANLYVQVQQRQGKTIAHGSGFSNGTAICNDTFVNQASAVVVPDFYPGFTSAPFKKGAALATVSGTACSTVAISGPFGPCDFGNAGPSAISVK